MKIIGVDLHARQQTIAMLDTDTGELVEKTLEHAGDEVWKFYSTLSGQVVVGIEATGSMQWFLKLKSWGSNAAWDIPRKSVRPRPASRSMIASTGYLYRHVRTPLLRIGSHLTPKGLGRKRDFSGNPMSTIS